MSPPVPASARRASIHYEHHLRAAFPTIQAASARLQSSFGLYNATPFALPRAPAMPASPGSDDSDEADSDDGAEAPEGLVAVLAAHCAPRPSSRRDLVELSVHDLTPDMRTGGFRNVLLLHRRGEDMARLRVYEVDVPCRTSTGPTATGPTAGVGGGVGVWGGLERWTWFVLEEKATPEPTLTPTTSDTDDDEAEDEEGEGDEGKQGEPGPWLAFGCPLHAVECVEERREKTVTPGGGKRDLKRVELNLSRGGVPVFDGDVSSPAFAPPASSDPASSASPHAAEDDAGAEGEGQGQGQGEGEGEGEGEGMGEGKGEAEAEGEGCGDGGEGSVRAAMVRAMARGACRVRYLYEPAGTGRGGKAAAGMPPPPRTGRAS
ncbi:MAG: hypothetical protein M1832_005440 [Thelocarpon impressellum]|nr:MAG: hypothetical protein M1832_005440 [Thelocarpon impressellum]